VSLKEIGEAKREARFPKSARLLKKRDFRFRRYRRFHTEFFQFVYALEGKQRLGISISKKVLRRAVARNRIRRLWKEVFRLQRVDLPHLDLHVIGLLPLSKVWTGWKKHDIEDQFRQWQDELRKEKPEFGALHPRA
jgi:ribonuclease P protein component